MTAPTLVVTPGTGATVYTLGAPLSTTANSPVTALPSDQVVSVQPAAAGLPASGVTAVVSTFGATGSSATLTPIAGRGFNVSIWGTFSASVQLERSFDGGTTWLPITAAGVQLFVWTAPASEVNQEDQISVAYRLRCTAYTSGTVSYRISQ